MPHSGETEPLRAERIGGRVGADQRQRDLSGQRPRRDGQRLAELGRLARDQAQVLAMRTHRHDPQTALPCFVLGRRRPRIRSEEHTSELQSLMRISYAVFCLKKKITHTETY